MIIGIDANSDYNNSSSYISNMKLNCNTNDWFKYNQPYQLNIETYGLGNNHIYKILISTSLHPCIQYFYLLHNNCIQKSNHKEVLLDLDEIRLFKYKLDNNKLSTRKLHMNQHIVVDRYLQIMNSYDKRHKFQ